MHIPDNYLSPQTDAVMAVAMVPVWIHCIKKVRATLDREHMAFLGICAAFSFLLMMFNVPLPGGTTGHAVGGALIALLLGPEAAAIAVSVALALQALLFGDGGGMADPYFVLKDLPSFVATQKRVNDDYLDRDRWLRMAIVNTAKSGIFAADRTIREYNDKIWHLKPLRL